MPSFLHFLIILEMCYVRCWCQIPITSHWENKLEVFVYEKPMPSNPSASACRASSLLAPNNFLLRRDAPTAAAAETKVRPENLISPRPNFRSTPKVHFRFFFFCLSRKFPETTPSIFVCFFAIVGCLRLNSSDLIDPVPNLWYSSWDYIPIPRNSRSSTQLVTFIENFVTGRFAKVNAVLEQNNCNLSKITAKPRSYNIGLLFGTFCSNWSKIRLRQFALVCSKRPITVDFWWMWPKCFLINVTFRGMGSPRFLKV